MALLQSSRAKRKQDMSFALGTAQMLAAVIVEGESAFLRPHFAITVHSPRQMAMLAVIWGEDSRTLCSTRNIAAPREFATVDAAINAAKAIARQAGHADNHAWTGEAESLPVMPEIKIRIA